MVAPGASDLGDTGARVRWRGGQETGWGRGRCGAGGDGVGDGEEGAVWFRKTGQGHQVIPDAEARVGFSISSNLGTN